MIIVPILLHVQRQISFELTMLFLYYVYPCFRQNSLSREQGLSYF
jgi:hypothetical protein